MIKAMPLNNPSGQGIRGAILMSAALMVRREWRRALMEPSRILGVLAQPLLFLIVFGMGFHDNFWLKEEHIHYIDFFYPGVLGLVILFSSIYATLTLVEDKRCGFFRLALVAPGGVLGAITGKVVATASLGFVQGLMFLPLCLFLNTELKPVSIFWVLLFLLLGALCFSLIGVLFAWISPSASAFHALMSIILIPMWLLSGAMFPIDHGWFSHLGYVNPMTYLINGLRSALLFFDDLVLLNLLALLFFSLLNSILLLVAVKRRPIE